MTRSAAHLSDVSKRYGRTPALTHVDLDLAPGVTALLGRNGAGKSTLVRLLVGVERPDSGEIRIDALAGGASEPSSRRLVGWLPQAFGFPRAMRVREFVAYAAWLKQVEGHPAEAADRAMEFASVSDVADRRLGALSGGTLRRVGLAAAVAHRPRLLVLDEPTTGLDPIQRAGLHERVAALSDTCTVLIATHILEDVVALADRVAVIDGGTNVWGGSARELGALSGSAGDDVDHLRAGFTHLVGSADS